MPNDPTLPELVARLRRRQRAALRQLEADLAALDPEPRAWADRAHARETAELAYHAAMAAAWEAYVTERSRIQ